MDAQATIKRVRRETGKARTIARKTQAARRAAEMRDSDRAFAALLATTAGRQNVTAY